jgi:PAS domain S-box-containing protein
MEVYVPVTERRAESPEELVLRGAGQEKKQLGILVLDIPLKGAVATENRTAKKNTLVLAGVYSGILLAAFLLTGLALRPIPRLMAGTERIRLGDYDAHISVSSHDEFGDLARSFNEMAKTLSGTIVSKNYLDAIVDNMVETLVVTDMGGVIRRTNTAARAIIGRPDKDLTNTGVMDLFPWEGREPGGWLALLRKNGEVRDFETVLAAGPGVTVPVLVSASFIQDNEGNNSGIVAVIRDITLRKKYETEMLRSNEDLQRFAFVASHDLQEPLRTISNYIQLLESKYRTVLGPEAERHADFITGAVGRMRSLVRDLLEYSKIDAALNLKEVDSEEALDYVLAILQDSISSSGAVIQRGELPRLRADRGHLERLLQNLISNAIKFRGDAPPLVRVGAEQGPAGWTFHVKDNGIGIEEKYGAKLFKLFGRLQGKGVDGAGIGLASCKKIVDYYGGKIWFESEPGKGSTFFFSIHAQHDAA